MPISPVDLHSLSRLLDECLALPSAEREAWLRALPPPFRHLAGPLRDMLADQERLAADPLLSQLPDLAESEPTDAAASLSIAGERIGPYRLVQRIGRGGMGEVWLAERADGAYERRVALKLPRLLVAEDLASNLASRMAGERQIAARLEHPNIARLYDTGIDATGRPFIAMEFIQGRNIDIHCRELALCVPARLRLAVQVLRAMAYAHGRLVVHRDIKPANVLVSEDGTAYLLDFGIAALLGEGRPAATRGLTPRYAAPEQMVGGAPGVPADVYSLGALLHELLTDTLPNAQPASERVPDAVRRRALRGELDAILAKALQADPAQRYASADAFAEDIERHLRGDSVGVWAGSAAHRFARALRRHWIGASATAAVLLALLGGGAVALVQMHQAGEATQRERVVKDFMTEVFAHSSRRIGPSGEDRQDLLDHSAQLIGTRFGDQPALQAELYGVVGAAYAEMGAHRLAAELFARQIGTLQQLGTFAPQLAAARLSHVEALLDDGAREEAGKQLAEAQALLRPDLQAPRLRAAVLAARLEVEMGRYNKAEQGLRGLETQLDNAPGEHGRERAWVLALRAEAQARQGHAAEALPTFERAAVLAEQVDGPSSLTAATIRLRAAPWYAQNGELEASERLFGKGIAALRAHGELQRIRAAVQVARHWSSLYNSMQRVPFSAAREGTEQSLEFLRAQGNAVPAQMLAGVEDSLAAMYVNWGDIQRAAPLARRSGPLRVAAARTPGERIVPLGSVGIFAMHAGDHVAAEAALDERLQARDAAGLRLTLYRANDMRLAALNASMAGWPDKAFKALEGGPGEAALREKGLDPQWYSETLNLARARVLIDRAVPGDAASALVLLNIPRPPRPRQDRALLAAGTAPAGLRGEALCQLGRSGEGVALLQAYLDSISPDRYEHAPQVARLRAVMGLCALQAGHRGLARSLAAQARASFAAQPGVSAYYQAPLLRLEQRLP